MAIDHEAHKIRIKAISDKMSHPIEYNDAGAPKNDREEDTNYERRNKESMRQMRRDGRLRDMITGGR